jgi:hypothetical protein
VQMSHNRAYYATEHARNKQETHTERVYSNMCYDVHTDDVDSSSRLHYSSCHYSTQEFLGLVVTSVDRHVVYISVTR